MTLKALEIDSLYQIFSVPPLPRGEVGLPDSNFGYIQPILMKFGVNNLKGPFNRFPLSISKLFSILPLSNKNILFETNILPKQVNHKQIGASVMSYMRCILLLYVHPAEWILLQ